MSTLPVVLAPNLPETFYRASGRLAAFREMSLEPRPEDWVASTTARFRHAPAGLSALPDGTLLADSIRNDPIGWLGGEHVETFGADPAVLVKLLDTGQRLPVHVHPSRDFARAHLASPFGKSEAWIVLDAAPGAEVHLGFNRDISFDELRGWVAEQDVAALLAVTNRIPVQAGDVLFCPAGTPHAVGEDLLLVEVQEPTDFSVLLEQAGFPVSADDALLGLPMDLALACVDRRRISPTGLAALRGGRSGSLLPTMADPFFRADLLRTGDAVVGFSVLIVTDGSGKLGGEWGEMPVRRGMTLAVPHAAGASRIDGDVSVIRCAGGR
ncbi:MAG: mannose-6-phosphate isomerase [Pseudonocardiales bacterium]|jgi:mannose-6-phosphate isomerase|nr:mannose-6-phosphate isomerase [Pseudonocardiales bacterium]